MPRRGRAYTFGWATLAAACAFLFGAPRVAGAAAIPSLTVAVRGVSQTESFTWTSATTTLGTTYTVFRATGASSVSLYGVRGTTYAAVTDGLAGGVSGGTIQSACYGVRARIPVAPAPGYEDYFSQAVCHSVIHQNAFSNAEGITRVDGNGTQLGFNNLWKFTYFLTDDYYVTLKVIHSSVSFTNDANGFPELSTTTICPTTTGACTAIQKIVLSSAPRTGELEGLSSQSNTDFWDSRNSSGTLVPNGIYKMHWTINDSNDRVVHKMVRTVPVDTLRITEFTTTGIAASGGNATIKYTITSDASVRLLIAKPGRTLVLDSNGDIQPLNPTNNLIDTSTGSVIQVINFNRTAGAQTEQWNGTDSNGLAASSGVYVAGISAKDTFGNQATGPNNDQQPISATIAVDRTAQQVAIDNTPPTITIVKVGDTTINMAGGTPVPAFSTVTFTLSETGGTGSNISFVSLTGPSGSVAGGTVTVNGTEVTFATIPAHAPTSKQSTSGNYSVTITAKDPFGNATSPTSFNFNIPVPVPPTVSSVTVGTVKLGSSGTNIVKTFDQIRFFLATAAGAFAGTGANISTVTVTYHSPSGDLNLAGTTSATGSDSIVIWSTATTITSSGSYVAHLYARDSVGTQASAVHASSFTLSNDPPPTVFKLTLGTNQKFSWTEPEDPACVNCIETVYLYRRAGFTDPLVNGTLIAQRVDEFLVDEIDFNAKYPGTACYVALASNTVSGIFGKSDTVCHSFMHTVGNGSVDGVTRTDGNGGQLGFNNLWKFDYFLDDDAFVTMAVYDSSVAFVTDGNGFQNLSNSTICPTGGAGGCTNQIKTIVSSAPRSGELFTGGVKNTDFWDSRNSSGTLVSNGIYRVHFTIHNTAGTIIHRTLTTVPVDVLRITEFKTLGITSSGGNATLTYNITADASVRMLIAKPGRMLTRDSNGDVQALHVTTGLIDSTKESVVQIINFNRSAGTNVEQWNGTDFDGVAVASGVYVVGISAKDTYGNQATGPTGDQQPISATIPVDRTAQQVAIDNTPPVISSVTVGSKLIDQAGGTSVVAFNSITFDLTETAGAGTNISLVGLTGPGGAVAGGTVTVNGRIVTYSTGTQSAVGNYQVTITAKDSFGNGTAQKTFNFNIPTPVPPTVQSIAVGGKSLVLSGGTIAKPFDTISAVLATTAGTFASSDTVITVKYASPSGELNLGGSVSGTGSDTSVTWSTPTAISSTGTYTVIVRARDTAGTWTVANTTVTFTLPTAVPPPTVFKLTLGANQAYSWTSAVDPAAPAADVTYLLYRRSGFLDPQVGGTLISQVFKNTAINFAQKYPATACYVAIASTTVSGAFGISDTVCHSYMHFTGNGSDDGVLRSDGAGTQIGFNNLWKFDYFLDADSFVTMKIYESSVTFVKDANGFTDLLSQATAPVKVVLSSAPRSGELFAGTVKNTDFWDSRNSSGTLVKNGVYFLHITVQDLNGTIVHKTLTTIPVDVLRITEFTTKGIAASGGNATIKYTVTADASVRLLIAKPGRRLAVDSNGDIQALDPTNNLIDTSTGSVVQIINFNRSAGDNTEQWNGTDLSGVAVSSGVYVAGISARDSYGNQATSPTNDQQPIAATIAVDRTASQSSTDTQAPSVSSVTVGAIRINQAGNSSVSAFTTIVFTLNETAGTGSNISVVTLTGPAGAVLGGNVTATGNDVTYAAPASQASSGTYTITLVAKDAFGNQTSQQTYTCNIPGAGGGGGNPVISPDAFKASVVPFPNPVKSGPMKINFTVANNASVDFDLYTLSGQHVFHQTQTFGAGTGTFNWNLVNTAGSSVASGVYLLRITSNDGGNILKATKKVMIVR